MDRLDWIMPAAFLAATGFTFLRLMAASREAALWKAHNNAEEAAGADRRRRREAARIAQSSDVDVV